MQLLRAVSALRGGVKGNEFKKFILCTLKGMDQRGRCTVIMQYSRRGGTLTACKGQVVSTDMPNCPDEVIA